MSLRISLFEDSKFDIKIKSTILKFLFNIFSFIFIEGKFNPKEFSEKVSYETLGKQSFIYKALSGIRTKIDDPLGKKRGSLGK